MDNNHRGILCVLVAMTLFSIQDVLFKMIADTASMLQVVVIRGLIGSGLIIAYVKLRGQPIRVGTAYPMRTILRGFLFLGGFMCFYIALTLMPIAEATALFFVSPFFISILSVLFFKTPIGWHRMAAIVLGFLGMLLVVKPNPTNFNWASLLPVVCAFTYALSMMIAKQTSEKDSSLQQALHMYIAAILLGGMLSAAFSGSPTNHSGMAFVVRAWSIHWDFVLLATLIISVIGSLGIVLIITAYRIAEPSVIAPFEYTALFVALILGYVVFNERIDLYSLSGMGLIVTSGVYIFWREKVRNKPVAIKTSLRR